MPRKMIRNAKIVNTQGVETGDILIEREKILQVGKNLQDKQAAVFDVEGKYIFPGFIDAHTHMGVPVRGTRSADDFSSGSLAALYGGVTTIIDFTVQDKGRSLQESIARRKKQADGRTSVDYALHCNVTDLDENRLREIPSVIEQGIISFKAFTAYREAGMQLDDRQIMDLLWEVKQAGGTVMFHAENGDIISFLTDAFVRQGDTDAIFHAHSRPVLAEVEAVSRMVTLNQFIQCPLYFVHLTAAESVQIASMAKQGGQNVYLETCPQYLLFDQSVYEQPDGYRYIAAPPFRSKKDSEYLWQALQKGEIDVVGSDHCPFTLEQKEMGKRQFHLTPNGLPGVETLFALLYSEGVQKKRLSPERLVGLIAEEPARLFGLFPQKGIIMEGADADLVVFDMNSENTISAERLHSATDWSPYEGLKTKGRVESVMLRGQWLLQEGKVVEENLNKGRFVPALL